MKTKCLAFSFLLFVSFHLSHSQNLDSMLLLYYPFNGNANDASGNNYHGTVSNASLSNDRFGNPNSAYYFNGTNSYIDFPNLAALKPPLPVSFAFWVKFDDLTMENEQILTTDFFQNSYTGIWFNLNPSSKAMQASYGCGIPGVTGPNARRTKTGTTSLQINTWYFVVCIIRGPTDMTIYINCVDDMGYYHGSGTQMVYSSNPGTLGRHDLLLNNPYYFKGYLDEFRYWDRALTQADIDLMCTMHVDAGNHITICEGDSVVIGGIPAVQGGTPPVIWEWTPATGLSDPFAQNPIASPSVTTTYFIQATDYFGFVLTDSVTVTVLPVEDASILTPWSYYCPDFPADTLQALNPGGIWWGSGITDDSLGIFNPSAAGPGLHIIYHTLPGVCSDTAQVNLTVYPYAPVNLGPDTAFCTGDSVVLDAGSGFSSYLWNPSGNSQTITANTPGTYTVEVTDTNLCLGYDTIVVNELPWANATINPVSSYCDNHLPDTLSPVQNGGIWWGNGITDPAEGVFDPQAAGAGIHIINYAFAGLCGDTSSVSINVLPAPVVNLGPDTIICSGNSITLDAGPGMSSYSWLPAGNTQTINVNTSGTYSVEVTDATLCYGRDTIVVNVIPWANAAINPVSFFCNNHLPDTLSPVQNGGIWWGNGITDPVAGVFNPQIAGTGIHTIFYGIAGLCGDTSSINITVMPAPVVNLGPDTMICSGNSVTLDAGPGMSSYSWLPAGNTQTINVNTSGSYSVTVTDATTCQGSDMINIIVLPQADASISNPGSFCSNHPSENLSAAQTGGSWSGTGITNPAAGTFDPSAAGPGNHEVIYSIAGLCGDADTVVITVFPFPLIDLGADTTFCTGDSIVLDAGAGMANYAWNPAGTSQSVTVYSSGTYSVTITDFNSCQNVDSVFVTVLPWADASIANPGSFCSNHPSENLSAAQTGGSWSGTGITNPTAGTFDPSAAGPGNHEVIYSIAGLCGDADTVDIIVWPSPVIELLQHDETCIDASDGWAYVVITEGTEPYQIVWSNSETTDTISGLQAGTYSIMVSDTNGCSSSASFSIFAGTEDCYPSTIYIPNIFSPNGDGENDVLYVRGENIQYLEFIIYDRWGEKIFESFDQQKGWDGTYLGEMCDPAVFVYVVKATFNNGNQIALHGNVTLVR